MGVGLGDKLRTKVLILQHHGVIKQCWRMYIGQIPLLAGCMWMQSSCRRGAVGGD